ncbi:MAG: hypothetical protein M1816_006777 [Peltula sp. TS41687]|nr:MAG: hypothetical protein M1816_006777 [Peltula sp. TS41687]
MPRSQNDGVLEPPTSLTASSTPTFILLYGKYMPSSPPGAYTYVLTPAALVASTHRSWSIFHWFWIPPAVARVVPTALKTAEGAGWSCEIMPPHLVVSASWMASSLGGEGLGGRREMVATEGNASLFRRRVLRMWLPTTAAVGHVGTGGRGRLEMSRDMRYKYLRPEYCED